MCIGQQTLYLSYFHQAMYFPILPRIQKPISDWKRSNEDPKPMAPIQLQPCLKYDWMLTILHYVMTKSAWDLRSMQQSEVNY